MIRNLFKLLTKIYPASKLFNYVMEGITSKNSKTRMGRFVLFVLYLLQFLYKYYFLDSFKPSDKWNEYNSQCNLWRLRLDIYLSLS